MKLKYIRIRPLISHVGITLIYPAARAIVSKNNRLLIFTDSLTIISVILLIGGIVYTFVLHGDFDISSFLLMRGVRKEAQKPQSFDAFFADRKAKREEAFNYPLFLGIVYLVVSIILAYVFF